MTRADSTVDFPRKSTHASWFLVPGWPASANGWLRAILIATAGLGFVAMIHKYQTDLEVACGVHGLRSMNPACQTIELRHEDGDIYVLNCTDAPRWTLAANDS